MMSKGQKPSLVMDGWWSAGNRRMDGIVVSIGKESFPLSVATAEPDHDDNDSAVARAMQTILEKHKNHIVHCMDNAGPCASVRRTLQLVHSNILFTTCFAHQINLMVKGALKSTACCKAGANAIAAAKAIKASGEFFSELTTNMRDTYELGAPKQSLAIIPAKHGQWNSVQACFASQLRVRSVCMTLAATNATSLEFPNALKCWASNAFWDELEQAELVVRPFCDASFFLQRERTTTAADVVLVLANLVIHLLKYCSQVAEAEHVMLDLEARWRNEENSLFFLAFALHAR